MGSDPVGAICVPDLPTLLSIKPEDELRGTFKSFLDRRAHGRSRPVRSCSQSSFSLDISYKSEKASIYGNVTYVKVVWLHPR